MRKHYFKIVDILNMEKQTTETDNALLSIFTAILLLFIAWMFIESHRSSKRYTALKQSIADGQNGDGEKLKNDIGNVKDSISKSYRKIENSYAA